MCWRCVRPSVSCICDLVVRVSQRTRVTIFQHPRESRHPFGTVRLARLGLTDVDVQIPTKAAAGTLMCTPLPSSIAAVLLYPTEDAVDIRDLWPRPTTLVVVDGTWSTARKLVRDNPWLAALPRVKVTPPRPGNYRIRRAPDPTRQVSTIEAIVYALQALEGEDAGLSHLLAAFDSMVDRQLALQHAAP